MNEAKTRRCRLPDESFDFLGYTIGRCYSPKTGRAYLGTRPSTKKVQRLCREISEMTGRRSVLRSVEEQRKAINRKLLGWSQLLQSRPCEQSLSRRGPTRCETAPPMDVAQGTGTGPGDRTLPRTSISTDTLGLLRLSDRTAPSPWANA